MAWSIAGFEPNRGFNFFRQPGDSGPRDSEWRSLSFFIIPIGHLSPSFRPIGTLFTAGFQSQLSVRKGEREVPLRASAQRLECRDALGKILEYLCAV
jgi:hypothetical protein